MLRKIIICCLFIINGFAFDATIEIIKDTTKLPSIAVENLNLNKNDVLTSSKIYEMLIADLKVSGHFNTLKKTTSNINMHYDEYTRENINLVARIESKIGVNEVVVNLTLYDINIQKIVIDKQYTISEESRYPFLAHKMATDINNYIKAPSIDWMNRFVVFSKYTKAEESYIVIADYTLTFQKTIIRDGLNIFPKWANSKQDSIYFTKYYDKPTLVKYNIYTGKMDKLLSSDGLLIASDVSVDGSKVLLSMAPNAQPDIYLFDTNKQTTQKLTNYSGIDVGANFINDEKSIMFISDRLGYPNIFSLDLSTKILSQLVFHGRNNSSASAFNEYVVYASRESENEFGSNTFNLYLISTKSDYIRRLTANGVNQMPRFSRDGGSIMFIKNTDKESSLGIIRLNYNKSYLFPLPSEKIQAIDW